jgi:hypothetical protein
MNSKSTSAGSAPASIQSARRLAENAEAVITDLEARVPTGMGALELALAERVRAVAARLLEIAEQLAAEPLVVEGSTGQPRPNPLLKLERELRHELAEALPKLVFRAEQGAMFARMQALTRKGGDRS